MMAVNMTLKIFLPMIMIITNMVLIICIFTIVIINIIISVALRDFLKTVLLFEREAVRGIWIRTTPPQFRIWGLVDGVVWS